MKFLISQIQNHVETVKKAGLLLMLLLLGFLMGMMREMQAQAQSDGNAVQTNYYAVVFFVIAGTAVPIVVALCKRWVEDNISRKRIWEEKERQLSRQMRVVSLEIETVTQKRDAVEDNLEGIISRFSKPYEKALAYKRRKELAWKAFDARLQSDMSMFSEAYRKTQAKWRNLQVMPKLKYLALPLLALLMLMLGCANAQASDWFVLCDRSSSSSNVCNKGVLKEAMSGWLKEATTGDKFEVFNIGADVHDVGPIYSIIAPKFRTPVIRNKSQWKKATLKDMDAVALPGSGKSAMFQAIWRVSRKINRRDSALILIADLRHVDKRYNFEKKVPSAKEFIKYLGVEGIGQVNLAGHHVYVCGFHPNATMDTSAPNANLLTQTKRLWEEVFNSWEIKTPIYEECNFEGF